MNSDLADKGRRPEAPKGLQEFFQEHLVDHRRGNDPQTMKNPFLGGFGSETESIQPSPPRSKHNSSYVST